MRWSLPDGCVFMFGARSCRKPMFRTLPNDATGTHFRYTHGAGHMRLWRWAGCGPNLFLFFNISVAFTNILEAFLKKNKSHITEVHEVSFPVFPPVHLTLFAFNNWWYCDLSVLSWRYRIPKMDESIDTKPGTAPRQTSVTRALHTIYAEVTDWT